MITHSRPTAGTDEAEAEATPMALGIARAAARLFAERGFDATSVREIAAAAGVTKPTLYYHFGSKQGLGEAILIRPMALLADRLAALAADGSGRDPVRLLEAAFQVQLDFVVDDPDRARFVYATCFGPAGSSFHDEMHRFGQSVTRSQLDIAAKLAATGLIDPARVEACAQVGRGLIMSSTLDHIFLGQQIEAGLAGRLASDLLDGFARPRGPAIERERSSS